MDIKYLLEALRGGNGNGGPPNTRRYPGGEVVGRDPSMQIRNGTFVNPNPPKPKSIMPKALRGYQLHNIEADLNETPRKSYEDWVKEQ